MRTQNNEARQKSGQLCYYGPERMEWKKTILIQVCIMEQIKETVLSTWKEVEEFYKKITPKHGIGIYVI